MAWQLVWSHEKRLTLDENDLTCRLYWGRCLQPGCRDILGRWYGCHQLSYSLTHRGAAKYLNNPGRVLWVSKVGKHCSMTSRWPTTGIPTKTSYEMSQCCDCIFSSVCVEGLKKNLFCNRRRHLETTSLQKKLRITLVKPIQLKILTKKLKFKMRHDFILKYFGSIKKRIFYVWMSCS